MPPVNRSPASQSVPIDAPLSVRDIDTAPARLPVAGASDWEAKYHLLYEKFNTVSDEKFIVQEKYEGLKSRRATEAQLDALIKPYAFRTFVFMCVYCGFAGIVLLLSGFQLLGFSIPEGVQQLLIGTTATTVIGLVGMVLTGVFVGARKR